jgi:hypothetical protein
MDITDYFGEVQTEQQKVDIKPGRYNLEYTHTDDEPRMGKNGWMGIRLNFKIQGTETFVTHTITIQHDDPKNVNWGREELMKMAKAAGIEGSIKDTDELRGKVISCSIKLNDNGYPETDSKFGNSWKPAEEVKATTKKVAAPKQEESEEDIEFEDSDDLPF